MTSVFIGGSRAISRLNPVLQSRLDDLMQRQCVIYVGDANGADKMVQTYLAARDYRDVVVYCMSRCRNNVGAWPTRSIESPSSAKDFAYYAAKDLAMARDASCGVMLWDGVSKGTLNNIQTLLDLGKKVLVYLSASQEFTKLTGRASLDAFLQQCDPAAVAAAQAQIQRKVAQTKQLSFATHP